MKKLHFDYDMKIQYSEPAGRCHFTIKCMPQDSRRQRVERLDIRLSSGAPYETGCDSFGNRLIYGRIDAPHEVFGFHVSGEVWTGLCSGTDAAAGIICEQYAKDGDVMRFRHPYGFNIEGGAIQAYYDSLALDAGLPEYERSVQLMHALHRDFSYEKNRTNIKTTAEEAWVLGKGVCQDYAHIMIALCRLAGIPARYVTGMLTGEGESHAWTEVLCGGNWYGLDPTNNVPVTDSHIRIGVGRDASDCLINRGVMFGGGSQTQEIRVSVEEKEC